ncbi:hypothetical protein J6590_064200 [Homalodisca vitripennis]|nr:hypothetical protein J6590_064200 [Homalodisca vitripennis]
MSKHNKYPCGVCGKCASTSAIFCNTCKSWNHLKCVNLIYNNVKNLSEEDCKSWKCPNCKQNYVEESGDERIVCDKHEEEPSNLEDSLTLAAEIGQALLRENEELKQALHETSNAKSVYELELEDKIKQKEEEIEIMLEKCKEKEELLLVITTLRNKLEEEKKLNMELILQAEQGNCGMVEKRKELPCTKCEILKNETKNMISSIRSLEIAAKEIKNENLVLQSKLNNSQCIQCFPPLKLNTGTKQNIVADQNKWQKVPVAHKKSVPPKIQTTSSWIDTNNRFEVLSGEETDEDEFGDDTEVATKSKEEGRKQINKNKSIFFKSTRQNKTKSKNQRHTATHTVKQNMHVTTRPSMESGTINKNKILILADSHGRGCGEHIRDRLGRMFVVTSIIKPNANFNDVIENIEELTESYQNGDYVIVLAGTNNFNNRTPDLDFRFDLIKQVARKTNVVIPGIPHRFDKLGFNTNDAIKRSNIKLIEYIRVSKLDNLNFVIVPNTKYTLHDQTKHGLHFNASGYVIPQATESELITLPHETYVDAVKGITDIPGGEAEFTTSTTSEVLQSHEERDSPVPVLTTTITKLDNKTCTDDFLGTQVPPPELQHRT